MAAAVLALAITTSLIAMGRAFAPLDSARCISYGSQIMQSEMERIRLMSWGPSSATAGTGPLVGGAVTTVTAIPTTETELTFASLGFATTGDLGSRMHLYWKASDEHTGMLRITLRIQWTTADRRTLSRSYVTFYGQNVLYDFFAA